MKKRIISFALALILVFSIIPFQARAASLASGECGNNVEWFITDDGTLNIGGNGPMYEFDMAFDRPPWLDYDYFVKSIVIGRGVTNISDFSFFGFYNTTYVEIPKTVTSIGWQAFSYCEALTEISLPDTLTHLGNFAFSSCYDLQRIEIPANVSSIGRGIFQDCYSLKNIEVNQDNSHYYNDSKGVLFSYDGLLVAAPGQLSGSYEIPDNITAIESNAFHGCRNVTKITIPKSVSSIGYSSFGDCTKLTAFSVDSGNQYFYNDEYGVLHSYGGTLIQAPGAYSGHYTIPSGTVALNGQAFFGCSKLTSITIPASVTTLGGGSFEYCTSLKEITFQGNAPEFSDYEVFRDVTATAYYPKNNSTWTDEIMEDYEGNITWVAYDSGGSDPTDPTDPTEPTDPGAGNVIASGKCGQNVNWTVDDSGVLRISGSGATYDYEEAEDLPWISYWDEVTSIMVESGVTTIGKQLFAGFTLVTQVSLPSTIKSIGTYAFLDCVSLTSLQIPSGVTTINDGAFAYCESLKSVTIPGTVQTLGTALFFECYDLSNVTLSEGLPYLSGGMFSHCTSLTQITIPASVTALKVSPFDGCTGLKSITFKGNAPSFSSSSFETVTATAYYPASNSTWTSSVRKNYGGNITWVAQGGSQEPGAPQPTIPAPDKTVASGYCGENGSSSVRWTLSANGVLTISGTGPMQDYEDIYHETFPAADVKYIMIESGVTTVGKNAFFDLDNVVAVSMPNTVTIIKLQAFDWCESLTEVVIPNSVTSLEGYAFCGTNLRSIHIPASVTDIKHGVFGRCANLTEISVDPNNTEYYSDGGVLFSYDGWLMQMPAGRSGRYNVPSGTTWLYHYSFFGCESITSVTLPTSITDLGSGAFMDCVGLSEIFFTGDAPSFYDDSEENGLPSFEGITATVYYPKNNGTWTRDVRQNYGGDIYWAAYDPSTVDIRNPFTDVKKSDYYYDAVIWAVENGITSGTSATKFSPNATCTRGQVVTFLWRAAGQPEPTSKVNPFSDVKSSDYFYKAVLWAVEKGITSGTGNGKFSPNAPCTRAQVATFLWRAEGEPDASGTNPFSDVRSSEYYYKAVLWAVEEGITAGTSATKFSPNAACTRGQIVTFLYRAEH